ncbi:MAG: hypothetical protein ACUVRX_11410 [Actinomycetota bacterium]
MLVLPATLTLIARHNKKFAKMMEMDEPGMRLHAAFTALPG